MHDYCILALCVYSLMCVLVVGVQQYLMYTSLHQLALECLVRLCICLASVHVKLIVMLLDCTCVIIVLYINISDRVVIT